MSDNSNTNQLIQEENPLLSIIIPTKNRYETLIPVLNALLEHIIGNDYEIVVQDNSDDNTTFQDYLNQNRDNRLKYFYYAGSISMSENTEKAIENSLGRYAIFIGDDDLVSPHIIEITEYAEKYGIDCLIYPTGYYWWNSVNFVEKSYYRRNQALWLPKNINYELRQIYSAKELENLLKNGGVSIYSSMPRFYHGLVKKEVLEKIKAKIGAYVSGSCPDMAFATSLTLVLDHYYHIQYPLSICGASKNSAAGWGQEKKHWGKLENQKFLPKDILDKWDKNIPRSWTSDTIWAQAVYETLTAFGVDRKINYNPLYASMIVNETSAAKGYVYPLLFGNNKGNNVRYFQFFYYIIRKCAGRILRKYMERKKKMPYDVSIIDNVNDCMQFLAEQTKPQF